MANREKSKKNHTEAIKGMYLKFSVCLNTIFGDFNPFSDFQKMLKLPQKWPLKSISSKKSHKNGITRPNLENVLL